MKLSLTWIRRGLGLAALTLFIVCSGCTQPNNSPVISSLTTEREWVTPSGKYRIECVARDADGDNLNYAWSATGGNFSGSGAINYWLAPSLSGTYTLTVTVTDGRGGKTENQLTLRVRDNRPPVIQNLTAIPRRVKVARTSTIECTATDPDGDELIYRWETTGGNISGKSSSVKWTAPNREGNYVIRVIVTDIMGRGDSKELEVVVTCDCGTSTVSRQIAPQPSTLVP